MPGCHLDSHFKRHRGFQAILLLYEKYSLPPTFSEHAMIDPMKKMMRGAKIKVCSPNNFSMGQPQEKWILYRLQVHDEPASNHEQQSPYSEYSFETHQSTKPYKGVTCNMSIYKLSMWPISNLPMGLKWARFAQAKLSHTGGACSNGSKNLKV